RAALRREDRCAVPVEGQPAFVPDVERALEAVLAVLLELDRRAVGDVRDESLQQLLDVLVAGRVDVARERHDARRRPGRAGAGTGPAGAWRRGVRRSGVRRGPRDG